MSTILMAIIGVVGVIVILGLLFAARYKTVGTEKAMIVTGSYLGKGKNVVTDDDGSSMKIIRGGGAFILPIFQQEGKLTLNSHTLEVLTPEVYTEQGVPVMADGVAIIKVGGTTEDIATAAEQFMGKPDDFIKGQAQEVLEGHLRAILGSMTVEEIYKNRDKFAQEVQRVASLDLKKMGLVIVSFTIKDVRDKNGYLASLGVPQIEAVKRDARNAKADADKEARIREANAEEIAKKAELAKETNIAESEKEKSLKVSAFKQEQDKAKALADQAYKLQQAISQREVIDQEMQVEITRKQREIELEEKEIQRREKQYDAEVKKKADADRYAVEQSAEAEKSRIIKEAEARAEQHKVEGFANAEATRAEGTAKAEVTQLQMEAEAEGKRKLAEAYEKFGEAAVLELVLKMLPELAAQIAHPMASIDKVTVIDSGNGTGDGVNRLSNNVTKLMNQLPEMLKDTTGLDLNSMIAGLMAPKAMATKQVIETLDNLEDLKK